MNVKKYLNLEEKFTLVNDVVESCVNDYQLDVIQKEVSKVVYITLGYVEDFEVAEKDGEFEVVETYDNLMKDNLYFKKIYKKIPKQERKLIERLIDESINEKLRQGGTLTGIMSKVSELDFTTIAKQFNDLDIKKMDKVIKMAKVNNPR